MTFDGNPPIADDTVDVVPPGQEDRQRIRLANGGAVLLEPEGFRLIGPRGLRRSPTHPYESVTHATLAARSLLIGTTGGLLTLRTADFSEPETGPAHARAAILDRVGRLPDGAARREAMAGLDALAARPTRPWAVWTTILLCLFGTGFQLRDPLIDQIGAFVPQLFVRGELWRGVTAHLLHALPPGPGAFEAWIPGLRGLPFHLAINVGGLVVMGPLVERPMGRWRTVLVLLAGGVGTIVGILMAGHREVIGASGLVAALAGASLALELHHPASLPAQFRLPRRLFLIAVFLQFGLIDPLMRSFIAGGAHLGGFAGGYAMAWRLGASTDRAARASSRIRRAALAATFMAFALGFGIVPLARHQPAALERHAARLLNVPPEPHLFLHENAAAWFIATEGKPSDSALALALALADRAVAATERLHPGVLDTLAETLFQSGDRTAAILTIDEAIALMPWERYFVEQRKRFTGERAADDRPPQPGSEAPLEGELEPIEPLLDPDAPSVTI